MRKSKKISKRKLKNMVLLFERKVDAEIESIHYQHKTITTIDGDEYQVSLSRNTVDKIYPDLDFS